MQIDQPFYLIPLWAFFLCVLLLVLVSVEGGYRLGKYRSRRPEQEKESPVGAMVAATLGLLALLLAFTFGVAATRSAERTQSVLDEANAIGTTYLRAEMFPAHKEEIRKLLRDYVAARLGALQSGDIAQAVRQSEAVQKRLWAEAVAMERQNPDSIAVGLFVESLNEMIDLHATRTLVGLRSPIPGAIWVALLAVAFLSFSAMGYHAGLVGTTRSVAALIIALTFSVVMGLIADLDRPQEGFLNVSQQTLVDLERSMH